MAEHALHSSTSRAAAWAARLLALLVAVAALSHLAACGCGGDDGHGAVALPGVDCQARPELCT